MKKTLTIILAIVLVLSVCFACVACGDKDNPTPTPTPGPTPEPTPEPDPGPGGDTGTPTQADLDVKAIIDSYASAWLINNAVDGDMSNALNMALSTVVSGYKSTVTSVKAKKDGNTYVLTYKFKDKTSTTATLTAPVVNNGIYAGKEYAGTTQDITADAVLGTIVNGLFKSIKKAVDTGATFTDNGFGFDATAYFDFHYGDSEDLYKYGLRVAGQIGIEAKDTFAGIEVVDDATVIGGLYYEGADLKSDCKLYLNAGDYKYYIDNADINAIVISVIDYIQGIINGADDSSTEMAGEIVGEEPFYNKEVENLSDLLPDSFKTIVGSILSTVVEDVSKTAVSNGTQYQVKVDLDDLLTGLIGSLGDMLSSIDLSSLPAPLNQLDLSSFQGVGGTVLISAVVNDADASLTDLELSYNCGKKDFRFNKEDKEAKVYGPINLAIGIKDFEIGAQTKADVLPSFAGYTYFSPLNADVTVEITVDETVPTTANDVYVARIISNVNPFAIENGVITYEVTKNGNDWAIGQITTATGTIRTNIEGTIYEFTATEFAMTGMDAIKTVESAVMNDNTIFTPVVNYIKDLITMFTPEEPVTPSEPVLPEEPASSGLSMDQIKQAIGIVNATKDLMAKWEADGILTYNLKGNAIEDYYLEINLDFERYNEVVALVREYLTFIDIGDFKFDETAAKVYVNCNYGDYEKMVYVSVEYMDTAVLVTVDGSKLESEGMFTVTVEVNDDVYQFVADGSKWESEGVVNVTYTAKTVKYVDVTLDTHNGTISATLLANDHTYNYSGALVLNKNGEDITGGSITIVLDKVSIEVRGSDAYVTVKGSTSFGLPTFEAGAKFGWTIENSSADVTAKVTLNSWGETVTTPDLSAKLEGEATGELNKLLGDVAQDIIRAISITVAE